MERKKETETGRKRGVVEEEREGDGDDKRDRGEDVETQGDETEVRE